MKWLMIENNVGKRDALAEERIPFMEVEITKPVNMQGIAFPEEELEKVAKIIEIPEKIKELKTNIAGLFLIEAVADYSVTFEGTKNFEHRAEFEPVLKEYAKRLSINIIVSNPHGVQSAPAEEKDELLRIKFFSAPEYKGTRPTASVFGITLDGGQRDSLIGSETGIQLVDQAGTNFGEIVNNNTLYVFFDLPHGHNTEKLMSKVMDAYIMAKMTPEEFAEWRKGEADRLRAKAEAEAKLAKGLYIQECGKRINSMKRETIEELNEAERRLNEISEEIVRLVRDEERLRLQLAHMESDSVEMEKRFADEYDRLLESSRVKAVKIDKGVISIFTDTLYIDYGGKVWEIGDFQINIRDTGRVNVINLRAYELTGNNHYQHPHVFGADGHNVCLGNISEGVARLIGQHEYSVVAQILIEFLQTIRPEGQYIKYLTDNWKPLDDDMMIVDDKDKLDEIKPEPPGVIAAIKKKKVVTKKDPNLFDDVAKDIENAMREAEAREEAA